MTELTIEITDYCPNNCSYCSSFSGPEKNTFIDVKKVEEILKDKIWDRINISGGEPLAHPNFYQILILCKRHVTDRTGIVAVYTNALECILYNANILPGIRLEANLPVVPGVEKIHILKMIPQGYERQRPDIHYSKNWDHKDCQNCGHNIVKPDGSIAQSPCNKWR